MKTNLVLLGVLASLAAQPALALEDDRSGPTVIGEVFGGVNASMPITGGYGTAGNPAILSVSEQAGLAGGVGGEVKLIDWLSLETDALYVTRTFNVNFANGTASQTQHMVEAPLLVRGYLSPIFSVAAGPYFAEYFGNVSATATSGTNTVSATATYATAQQRTTDYGFQLGFRMEFPANENIGVIIDARYSFGLPNNSTDGQTSLKFNDTMILAGFRFSWWTDETNAAGHRRSH